MNTTPKSEWRCFHCDEIFTDRREAALHFGASEDQEPICLVLDRNDKNLLKVVRMAEDHAADMMHRLHEEHDDVHRSYRELHTRLHMAADAAQQKGYEKGLADSREEFIALMLATGKPTWRIPTEFFKRARGFALGRSGLMGEYEQYTLGQLEKPRV